MIVDMEKYSKIVEKLFLEPNRKPYDTLREEIFNLRGELPDDKKVVVNGVMDTVKKKLDFLSNHGIKTFEYLITDFVISNGTYEADSEKILLEFCDNCKSKKYRSLVEKGKKDQTLKDTIPIKYSPLYNDMENITFFTTRHLNIGSNREVI